MRYKVPAQLAAMSAEEVARLIREGKADVLVFADEQGRAVVILKDSDSLN